MEKDSKLYERTHKVIQPIFVTIIVNYGQQNFFIDLLQKYDSSVVLTTHGHGTKDFLTELFAAEANKKSIILGIVTEDKWNDLSQEINARFAVSESAKGIAFNISLTSVAGVSIYKYLVNDRKIDKKLITISKKGGKKDGKKEI